MNVTCGADSGVADATLRFSSELEPALKGRPKIMPSLRDDATVTALLHYRSNAFRSHFAKFAPASYVLCRKSINAVSGEGDWRTAS
jgi:hypothetical protein